MSYYRRLQTSLSPSSGEFPSNLKSSRIRPSLRKQNLDQEIFANFRPIANLSFLSKTIERMVVDQTSISLTGQWTVCLNSMRMSKAPFNRILLRVSNDILRAVDLRISLLLSTPLIMTFCYIDFTFDLDFLDLFRTYLHGRSQCVIWNVMFHKVRFMYSSLPYVFLIRADNLYPMLYANDSAQVFIINAQACSSVHYHQSC